MLLEVWLVPKSKLPFTDKSVMLAFTDLDSHIHNTSPFYKVTLVKFWELLLWKYFCRLDALPVAKPTASKHQHHHHHRRRRCHRRRRRHHHRHQMHKDSITIPN